MIKTKKFFTFLLDKKYLITIFSVAFVLAAEHLFANEVDVRMGSIRSETLGLAAEGGITATIQATDNSAIEDEAFLSMDLAMKLGEHLNYWTIYVEGNTTPRQQRVSDVLSEVNADVGSALDRDGKGRFQLSAFFHTSEQENMEILLGLLDPTGLLDTSEVANDETSQFLGSAFVNNPTIDFPDYTLGFALSGHQDGQLGYTLVATSSHGLGDNVNLSYSELLDINAEGKGSFVAAEVHWQALLATLRFGSWINTADHALLNNKPDPGTEDNYGIYIVSDGTFGFTNWNLRLGLANENVAETGKFIAIAFERPIAGILCGFGLSRSEASSKIDPKPDAIIQSEFYAQFDLAKTLAITPSIQYIKNSGFGGGGVADEAVIIFSTRFTHYF